VCGIAGFAGEYPDALLPRMAESIAHRGPDGHGAIVLRRPGAAPVGFAHRRLSSIDLSPAGHQPMTVSCDACGCAHDAAAAERLWLTYNGEIYNFRELRADLEARGHTFHSTTDSEVVLHLYGEHGEDVLPRLNGIFAFALYDGRPAGRSTGVQPGDVLLARDGIGVKPLYYAPLDGGLLFASELKAILQSDAVPRDLDLVAVDLYLTYVWAPAPYTMLRAVRKLPPGGALLVRDGHIAREWRFYDVAYGERLAMEPAAIRAGLLERLERAVERQLVADVPVGAFLSGGLDSSSVVAMMRRVQPDVRPTCYTIAFPNAKRVDGNPADLPYARRVAAHLDVELREIVVEADMFRQLDRMLYLLDEPQADVAPINALLIAQQAQADGIKVLLSGAGGDDILTGYRRHVPIAFERGWQWLPQRVLHAVGSTARRAGRGGALMHSRHVRRLVKATSCVDLDDDRRLISYLAWNDRALRQSVYTADVRTRLLGADADAPLLRSLEALNGEAAPINRMLYLETKHFLADHNLNYTDRMGMAYGVEVRVPFLDPDLVAFAARIPPAQKQRGRTGKAVLKEAMLRDLPRDVVYRPKTGFGAPLRNWLRNELRPVLDETLSRERLARRGLFDADAVHRLIQLDRQGRVDGMYTIFAMLCIERWLTMFVDPQTPREPGLL
jgi:asparagine synthase (glutamine-hydrolysing)